MSDIAERLRLAAERFIIDANSNAVNELRDRAMDAVAEISDLRELLAAARCPTCDGRGWFTQPGHVCRYEGDCETMCPQPVQVQCEWCDRVRSALALVMEPKSEDDPF